eukprot:CAMPEP_0175086920 /NCGR_PEP_ID=MMETSP0052_2-20121109/29534_1 /TAXON_ID=51329 ORGANISM="Polytomella parva, Strain SAG 63-3" /NCGR_SAMPLE_ID=MMETSP0052_2 /ASSEMBLY_ACC=CAM_ASM_000194 /LENGTH=168 /DNA_ID=CAMNT_0016359191 /DNA_START=106 /DNA_END=612 /DNA_ORIENTATION=-
MRVEEMVVGGIIKEAAHLLDHGIEPGQSCASKAIGYRQTMEWISKVRSENRLATIADLEGLVHSICAATHKLIHQQMSYHRKSNHYTWVSLSDENHTDVVTNLRRYLDAETPIQGGGCKMELNSGIMTKAEVKHIWTISPSTALIKSEIGQMALNDINQTVFRINNTS